MFFTTFNIKAEINRIIFVFSLSLPKEKSNEGFWDSGLPVQPPHKTAVTTPMEWCRGSIGNVSPKLVGAGGGDIDVPRSHFTRIPHRPQTSSPKRNGDSLLKMLCIDVACFLSGPVMIYLASPTPAYSPPREEMLVLPLS